MHCPQVRSPFMLQAGLFETCIHDTHTLNILSIDFSLSLISSSIMYIVGGLYRLFSVRREVCTGYSLRGSVYKRLFSVERSVDSM